MLFCSTSFLLFFLVYWLTPWHEARGFLLLVASFYFYASWNHWLALIIVFSTLLDYLIALGMENSSIPWRRRCLLLLSAPLRSTFGSRLTDLFGESNLMTINIHFASQSTWRSFVVGRVA